MSSIRSRAKKLSEIGAALSTPFAKGSDEGPFLANKVYRVSHMPVKCHLLEMT